MEEQKITINGLSINYKTFDPFFAEGSEGKQGMPSSAKASEDKPVLVLHGWGKGSDAWIAFGKAMAQKRYRVIIPDLPGFGKSEAPAGPWAVVDYLRFAEDFILEMKLKEINLVGHSFGGGLAAVLVAHDPALIKRLVLADAAVIRKERLDLRQHVAKIITQGKDIFMKLPFSEKMRPWAEKLVYRIAGAHDYQKTSGVMRETFKNILAEDLSSATDFIKIPAFVVWGDIDNSTPPADARELNKKIVGSRLRFIEGCGHNPQVTHPAELADLVSGFILNY